MASEARRTDTVGNFRYWVINDDDIIFTQHVPINGIQISIAAVPLSKCEYVIYEA